MLLGELAKQPKAPDAARLNLFRGQALLMLKQYADAEAAFGAGIKALPVNADKALEQNLAISKLDALFHQQKWKALAPAADELVLPDGKSQVRVAFQGALARYELGELQEAVPRLQKLKGVVKGTDYEQQTHFLLAESLRELGQTKEALPGTRRRPGCRVDLPARPCTAPALCSFRRMILRRRLRALRPSWPSTKGRAIRRVKSACRFSGRAHLEQKAYAKAEQVFETLLTGAGAGAEAALWQGRVFQRQGKQAEAEATVASALKRNAEDPLRLICCLIWGNIKWRNRSLPKRASRWISCCVNSRSTISARMPFAIMLCANIGQKTTRRVWRCAANSWPPMPGRLVRRT